jgi:hypothetical protein
MSNFTFAPIANVNAFEVALLFREKQTHQNCFPNQRMSYWKAILIGLLFFAPSGNYPLFSESANLNFFPFDFAPAVATEQTVTFCHDPRAQELANLTADLTSVYTLFIPDNSEKKKPSTPCLAEVNPDLSGFPTFKKKPFKVKPVFYNYLLVNSPFTYFHSTANRHAYQSMDMVTMLHAYRC